MGPAVKALVPHEMVPFDVKDETVAPVATRLPVDVSDPTVTAPADKLFVPTDKAPCPVMGPAVKP
jgi:hypothetical protein